MPTAQDVQALTDSLQSMTDRLGIEYTGIVGIVSNLVDRVIALEEKETA